MAFPRYGMGVSVRFRFLRKRKIDWDAAYSIGNYDGAKDEFEWGRYSLIGHLIKQKQSTKVLDVGCGYGLLRDFIPESCRYTGVDISQVATDNVLNRRPHDFFIACDIEKWQPDSTFDAAVFSEVLYYVKDVAGTLARVAEFLNHHGQLIASFFNHPSSTANRHAFEQTRQFLESSRFTISHALSVSTELPSHAAWSILAGVRS